MDALTPWEFMAVYEGWKSQQGEPELKPFTPEQHDALMEKHGGTGKPWQ